MKNIIRITINIIKLILFCSFQFAQFILIILGLQYVCNLFHIKESGIFNIPDLIPVFAFIFIFLPYFKIVKLEEEINLLRDSYKKNNI